MAPILGALKGELIALMRRRGVREGSVPGPHRAKLRNSRLLALALVGALIAGAVYFLKPEPKENKKPFEQIVATPQLAGVLANSFDNAKFLCLHIDHTNLASSPCEVSSWNSTVIASFDMTSNEARKTCDGLVEYMRGQGRRFDRGWTIQIRSPYSGEQSIAYCNLE